MKEANGIMISLMPVVMLPLWLMLFVFSEGCKLLLSWFYREIDEYLLENRRSFEKETTPGVSIPVVNRRLSAGPMGPNPTRILSKKLGKRSRKWLNGILISHIRL